MCWGDWHIHRLRLRVGNKGLTDQLLLVASVKVRWYTTAKMTKDNQSRVYPNEPKLSESVTFLTARDVADFLKLNVLTVYDYIRKGMLGAVKFGRQYRVSDRDLKAFIEKSQVQAKKKKGG